MAPTTSVVTPQRFASGLTFADYEALWRWSVSDLEGFWSAVWQFFGHQTDHAAWGG